MEQRQPPNQSFRTLVAALAVLALSAMTSTLGCAHTVPPRFSPGTAWEGFILRDGDGWLLAEAFGGPGWDPIKWSSESPALDPRGARWYRAELVIETCERRARVGWPRKRIWQRLAVKVPFLFRRQYEGATWSARLVSARPARWPGNWRNATSAASTEQGPIPFEGPLRVGVEYIAMLEAGRGGRWAVQTMEEPLFTGGRTIVWANPEVLPEGATPGKSVSATFRVQSAAPHVFAVGVVFAHSPAGGSFISTQYTAELTSVAKADD